MSRKLFAHQIANELRQQIRSGKLPASTAVPSAKQLAGTYGVSAQTVNKAMLALTEEGLLRRVQGSGTFVAEHAAAMNRKTFGIGFVIPNYDAVSVKTAFSNWRDTASSHLQSFGHSTRPVLFRDLFDKDHAAEALHGLDGLLLSFGEATDPRVIRTLPEFDIPVVVIMQDIPLTIPFHQVTPEIHSGFLRVAQLLRKNGIGKIVIAGYDKSVVTMVHRETALIAAALTAGFARDDIECLYENFLDGDPGRLVGRDLYPRLPKNRKDTVVFSMSDFVSFGIIDALRQDGREVGKDLLLFSYDDLEGDGMVPFGEPILSGIRIPRQRIAERAAELLIEVSGPRQSEEYVAVSIPVSVVLRRSFQPRQSSRRA